MSLQSEVSPYIIGDPNKDTLIEGDDTKSDDNESSPNTDEEMDLEEGEILDSAGEEEEKKDFANNTCSLKEALDKTLVQNIEELANLENKAKNIDSPSRSKIISPRKLNKLAAKYMDPDRLKGAPDHDDGWVTGSPKRRSKYSDRPIDYRTELEAYRGSPDSSPERKKRDEKRKKKSSKKSKKSKRTSKFKEMKIAKYKRDSVRGRICKFYKEGKCAKGSDCSYSHVSASSMFKKKELCRFYLNGHCNKGNDCLFIHGDFPCKFYHTGAECYAKNDCRFSHEPLSEEMQNILADYLKMSHGDDVRSKTIEDRDENRGSYERDQRKRQASPNLELQTPPTKRACLLGSPPRHIREAEETKKWREEMKMLQQQSHPSFEIRVTPDREESPSHFSKPNFYQETLLNTPSPKKRQQQPIAEASNPFHAISSIESSQESSSLYIYDDDEFVEIVVPPIKQEPPDDYSWNNMHRQPEEDIKPFNDNSHSDLDFTNDVKFDETTQFSEMESSTDCPPNLSPNSNCQTAMANNEIPNQEVIKEKLSSDEESSNSSHEASEPPIVVPSHLPRRQQELFKRVLQHQRKNALAAVTPSSPTNNEGIEIQIKKEELDVEEKAESQSKVKSLWYSSEEDDDDDYNDPLTDVLKKIQQAPLPKPVVQEPKPKVDLLEIVKKIGLNAPVKSEEPSNIQTQQQEPKHPPGSFWENLFGGIPHKPVAINNSNPPPSEPKRRTLLPNPVPVTKAEPIVVKDPRLKNRDPRKLANIPISASKVTTFDKSNENNISPSIVTQSAIIPKSEPGLAIEPSNDSFIPYRLRGISAKPPNYTPILSASQANPNLLKDPRLRKHLNPVQNHNPVIIGNEKDLDVVKPSTQPKDAPPIPELLLKYEPIKSINIFETSSPKPPSQKSNEVKPAPVVVYDPRNMRRDSRSDSGSDTPPHLTIVDGSSTPPREEKSAPILESEVEKKKWLPPVVEKSWTSLSQGKDWTSLVKKAVLEADNSAEATRMETNIESPKNSPPQSLLTKDEFVTVVKKEPSVDSTDNPNPVVPPLIIKKVKPTPPASHLPRAIADPRMAKLHDRRRPLVLSDANSKSIVERKKQSIQAKLSNLTNNISVDDSGSSNSSESPKPYIKETSKEEKPKSIPKKRRLSDKSDEKKKTVHRNRKSSMDYASPLNSYDATNDNGLNYNSYNQRPKRLSPNHKPPSPITEFSDTSVPEFLLHDSSNFECDNSNDVNLKDRFKTIDPTASPFC